MTNSFSQHSQEEDEIKYPRYFPLGHSLPHKLYTPCVLSFNTFISLTDIEPQTE